MPVSATPELLRELTDLHRRIAELEERAGLRPPRPPRGEGTIPDAPPGGLHEALGVLSDDVIAVLTRAGEIIHVNAAVERVFGYRPDEIVGRFAWGFVHPDDAASVAAARSTPLDEGLPLEVRVRAADGSYRWSEFTSRPWPSDEARLVVARWRRSNRQDPGLPLEERRLSDQLRRAAALARISQLALGLPQISDVLAAATGLAPGAVGLDAAAYLEPSGAALRVRVEAGFPPGARDREVPLVMTLVGLAWASGAPAHVSDLRRDGRLSDALLEEGDFASAVAVPVKGKERAHGVLLTAGRAARQLAPEEVHFVGTVANVVATSIDGREAQERLQARERLARAVFDHARDGLVVVDGVGRVTEVNEAAARILGVSREALRGHRPAELVRTDLDLSPTVPQVGEASVATPLGARRLDVERIPGIGADLGLAVLREAAEHREPLPAPALADRLVPAALLARGVVREIEAPLASLSAGLQLLHQSLGDEADPRQARVREAVQDAAQGAARLGSILDDLRTFLVHPMDAGAADLESVLRACVALTGAGSQARVRLEHSPEPLARVLGSPARLAQVFVCLMVNAARGPAADGAGSGTVRVSTRALDGQRVLVELGQVRGPPSAFEPLAPASGMGLGTALELSLCRSIVEPLGGSIEVEETPGRGSTYRVLLPVARRGA